MNYDEYIEENTIRIEATHRGGGIEIDCSEILDTPNARMTAYQNYLGGGMLGSIQSDTNFYESAIPEAKRALIKPLTRALQSYFHNLTNDEQDEWSSAEFDSIQLREASAY